MDTRPDSRSPHSVETDATAATRVGDDRTRRPDHREHLSLSCDDAAQPCEHGWSVESWHSTSIGIVLYVRCARCGVRRVDVQERAQEVPLALSAEVGCR